MRFPCPNCARVALASTLMISGLLFMSCNSEPILAEWHDSATDINGKPDLSELKGLRIKNVNARFVIANDDEQLILAIQTSDEALQRQIEVGGVTLWLTNPKNKHETFGVRYPALARPKGRPEKPIEFMEPGKDRLPLSANVELLSKQGEPRTLSQSDAGVAGVLAETKYEAKTVAHLIALQFDSLAPWMQAGNEITFSLYVPKAEGPKRMRPGGDDFEGKPPMGGGMGGMGRPPGGGGGMGRPGEGMPPGAIGGKEIRIQQTVVLATASTSQTSNP